MRPETGKTRIIFDTISDNAANAGIVLGAQRHALEAIDLRWVGAIVTATARSKKPGWGPAC